MTDEELKAQNLRFKLAVQALGSPDWVRWADENLPRCPKWTLVREAGLNLKDVGTYASVFVKLYMIKLKETEDNTAK